MASGDGVIKPGFERNWDWRSLLLVREGVGSDRTDLERLVDILEDQKDNPNRLPKEMGHLEELGTEKPKEQNLKGKNCKKRTLNKPKPK
jgi:hypothetical protein